MGRKRFKVGLCLSSLSVLVILAMSACSTQQATPNYPTKAIDLITPWGVGGAGDLASRLFVTYLTKKWSQPINVLNITGASTVTGTKRALEAAPDGYTILQDGHGSASMQAVVVPDLPYKWDDRRMIARVTLDPVYYVVRGDAPWGSLKEAMAYAKANPGKFKWATAGMASISAFAMALLFEASSVEITDTNIAMFASGAECYQAVGGGHADMTAQTLSGGAGLIDAKKVRILAIALPERVKQYPDAPTLKDAGYSFDIIAWQGIAGPSKLPDYVVKKWADTLKDLSKDPQFAEDADKIGKVVAYLGPEETTQLIHDEYSFYKRIGDKMGLK